MGAQTQNEWGGVDHEGPGGIARTSNDDGQTTVLFLERIGQGYTMVWQATFSALAPKALIDIELVAPTVSRDRPRRHQSTTRPAEHRPAPGVDPSVRNSSSRDIDTDPGR